MLFFYMFSIIGIQLFGGDIKYGNETKLTDDASVPHDYLLMNFNDFEAATTTLFALTVVNNWQFIAAEYVSFYDGNQFVLIYFILFYLGSVVIIFNIFIAVVLDMHSYTENLHEQQA